jgi:hypothetical protein
MVMINTHILVLYIFLLLACYTQVHSVIFLSLSIYISNIIHGTCDMDAIRVDA